MSKGLKFLLYIMTGLISFVIFLYYTFPFDILKDRILADVEKSLKGQYEIKVGSVSPKLLIGVSLKSVKIMKRSEEGSLPVWEIDSIKLKSSLFSLIFGKPSFKFDLKSGSSRIIGKINNEKNMTLINASIENLDLSKIPIFATKYGLMLKSSIDGEVKLDIDPKQMIRSSGKIVIRPDGIKVLQSKLKAGVMGEIEIPPIVIGAGKSLISAELKTGAVKIDSFMFENGDLNLNLKGAMYLSTNISNLRLNMKGDFDFSEKIGQALPFLFIIEKQKNETGKYPLSITGRLAKPQIKIGDFTIPL